MVSYTTLTPGYTVVGAPVTNPFQSLTANFSGMVTSEAIQQSLVDNPLGGLTYLFQVKNTSSAAALNVIQSLSQDYTGFSTSVFQLSTGLTGFATPGTLAGDAATTASRAADSTVQFNFSLPITGPGIRSGQFSDILAIQTNSKSAVLDDNVIENGSKAGKTATVLAYGPSSTPEASTMIPFGFVGLGLLGLVAARRKKAHATLA